MSATSSAAMTAPNGKDSTAKASASSKSPSKKPSDGGSYTRKYRIEIHKWNQNADGGPLVISAANLARALHFSIEWMWNDHVRKGMNKEQPDSRCFFSIYQVPDAESLWLTMDGVRLCMDGRSRRSKYMDRLEWAFAQGAGTHEYDVVYENGRAVSGLTPPAIRPLYYDTAQAKIVWENYSPPALEPLLIPMIRELSQKIDYISDAIEDRMNHLLRVVRRQEL